IPPKINDPDFERIDCEPLEKRVRNEIGAVIRPDHLDSLPETIERLCRDSQAYRENICRLRAEYIYNVGCSGTAGAQAILELAHQPAGV
ncbi:MAG: hypothetical protein IH987_05525, partial [Planctomycetes bacterium]|nr:hypothetical protein [Planctomycetota bacterium]